MTVPEGIDHQITCTFTDLLRFRTIAQFPIAGLQFSKVLNGAGSWSGSLNVEDEGVRHASWIAATEVNKTGFWVDIDKVLYFGGMVQNRNYHMAEGKVDLGGNDFISYLSQRLQALNYGFDFEDPEGRRWAVTESPGDPNGEQAPLRIAYYILAQALEKKHSIPLKVVTRGVTPRVSWITFSAPLSQQQSLASILSEIQAMGITVGIDYACDVAYDTRERPSATITLSYPRRGKLVGKAAPVIDTSSALDLEYSEDGSAQGNRIVELAGATTARTSEELWAPSFEEGYPLYEVVTSHSSIAPSGDSAFVLAALAAGDLSLLAYPSTTPVVTLPLFGPLGLDEIEVGDDIWLFIPFVEGEMPNNNPRFPRGLRFLFRLVRIDVEIPTEGVPIMKLTLNTLPEIKPVRPPVAIDGGGGGSKEKEEEEEEKEKEKEEKIIGEGDLEMELQVVKFKEAKDLFSFYLASPAAEKSLRLEEGASIEDVNPSELEEIPSNYLLTVTHLSKLVPSAATKVTFTLTGGPPINEEPEQEIPPLTAEKVGEDWFVVFYNIKPPSTTEPYPTGDAPINWKWHWVAEG